MKTKQEIIQIIGELPQSLVGGLAWDKKDVMNLRDSCLDMMKDVMNISNPSKILEIGLHAGSGAVLLLSHSNAELTSVDIGHTWIAPEYGFSDWSSPNKKGTGLNKVKEVLSRHFPNRFNLIIGDSTSEEVFDQIKDLKFELIFIDGDHSYAFCRKDIETAFKLNIPYILIDDFEWREPHVHNDERVKAAKDTGLIKIKEYHAIHNAADISCALFKNPNYK